MFLFSLFVCLLSPVDNSSFLVLPRRVCVPADSKEQLRNSNPKNHLQSLRFPSNRAGMSCRTEASSSRLQILMW